MDTNQYSGNFEREMCAFMTGHVGECGVGSEEAFEYKKFLQPISYIEFKTDEHGCSRPVEIFPIANLYSNGFNFYYRPGQEEQALVRYKEDATAYYRSRHAHDPVYLEKLLKKVNSTTAALQVPVYHSILIHFYNEPNEDDIRMMKQRAQMYANEYREGLKILGFRLYKCEKIETCEDV